MSAAPQPAFPRPSTVYPPPGAARDAASRPARAAFHRPELDVLRFCAFLLVFLHHALPHATADYEFLHFRPAQQLLAAIARGGALGVDLFFALSAYLITELLLREVEQRGHIQLRSFYIRRILRIWPLYFCALFALAPLMTILDPADHMPWPYVAGYSLLAGNWASAAWGYPLSSFALLWTVSIEEQFYLLWPCVVAHAARANRPDRAQLSKPLLRWIIGMVALAWFARIAMASFGETHPAVWTNTFARLDPIAGGAALAVMLGGAIPSLTSAKRNLLISAGIVLLIAVSAAGWHDGWGSILSYPLTAVACLTILYATLGWEKRTHFLSPALGYLGKISYGLYVLHAAAIRITEKAIMDSKLAIPAALLLTIALAAISYRFLESPFLRLKEKFATVRSRPV